jgi:hypothetical protein
MQIAYLTIYLAHFQEKKFHATAQKRKVDSLLYAAYLVRLREKRKFAMKVY